jgi:hypothetical protein
MALCNDRSKDFSELVDVYFPKNILKHEIKENSSSIPDDNYSVRSDAIVTSFPPDEYVCLMLSLV